MFIDSAISLAEDNANFFWDDATNQLLLGDGSLAVPAYSFGSDPNTGLFWGASEGVTTTINGTARIAARLNRNEYTAITSTAEGLGGVGVAHRFIDTTFRGVSGGAQALMQLQSTFAPASGSSDFYQLALIPTINQTLTALGNYTIIYMDVTETGALGSANKLADWKVGGTSMFSVDSAGQVLVTEQPDDSAPSIAMIGATDRGYGIGSSDLRMSVGGTLRLRVTGSGISARGNPTTSDPSLRVHTPSSIVRTSGTISHGQFDATFAPTSGDADLRFLSLIPTINQTSTATGDYVVLFIDVIETAFLGTNRYLIQAQLGGNDRFVVSASGAIIATQEIATSGTPAELLTMTGAAHTSLTDAEATDVHFDLGRTVTFDGDSNFTNQRAFQITAPTYASGAGPGDLTITNAATLYINAAPTAGSNVLLTNAYALWVDTGDSRFDGSVLTSSIDTDSAGTLLIGNVTQTSVIIGRSGIVTTLASSVTVSGTLTCAGASGLTTKVLTLNQAVKTSGTPDFMSITGAAHTSLTDAEAIDIHFDLARTVEFDGASDFALQRAVVFDAPTYAAEAAHVIAVAATVYITGAPAEGSNVTLTDTYALFVAAGNARFDGSVLTSSIDTDSAGTLTIGAANQTGITIGRSGINVTVGASMIIVGATLTTATHNANVNSIGTAQTTGISAQNLTSATVGAQQWSPMIRLKGEGWKTDATAGTRDVEFSWQVEPIQGADLPTGKMHLFSQINGAGWTDVMQVSDIGVLNLVSGGSISIADTKVIGARVVDAAIDDAVNSGDATTDGVITACRDALITHGLVAAA